jgi:5-methylthioadenosine/S-adenosylhomocysteine deaminase
MKAGESVDILIRNTTIVTMASPAIIDGGWIGIVGDHITGLGQPGAEPNALRTIEGGGKVVLPGLVNVHTHVCGSLFKSVIEDSPSSLYGLAFPAEQALTKGDAYLISRLGILECMKAGSTTINDLYHFPDATAQAAAEMGVRAVVASKVFDVNLARLRDGDYTRFPEEGRRRLRENVRLVEEWQGKAEGRITCRFGPHATDTCSERLLRETVREARQSKIGLHIHVGQKPQEVSLVQELYGKRPALFLDEIGLVGPDVVQAHMTFLEEEELVLLGQRGTRLAYCPATNAKRGFCVDLPTVLSKTSLEVGLGTDWLSMDPWEVMRFAICLGRMQAGSDLLLSSNDALRMATSGGALVLGMGQDIGSLVPGKKADMIMIGLERPRFTPTYDLISCLVYNAGGGDVDTVIVNGDVVIQDGAFLLGEEDEILREGRRACQRVWAKAGIRPSGRVN